MKFECSYCSTIIYAEGKKSPARAVNPGKVRKRQLPSAIVYKNHKSLDKISIYPFWIKHVEPIQYLHIIYPSNFLVFPRFNARLFVRPFIINNMFIVNNEWTDKKPGIKSWED